MGAAPDYDDRYLAGVRLFNAGEYFDAHEVWEDLWRDCPSADRRFYQSFIQAAGAPYHLGRGNPPRAVRAVPPPRPGIAPYRPPSPPPGADALCRGGLGVGPAARGE